MPTLLEKARARIADKERWCQEVNARTPDGKQCSATDPMAIMWCTNGALIRERPSHGNQRAYCHALDDLNKAARQLFATRSAELPWLGAAWGLSLAGAGTSLLVTAADQTGANAAILGTAGALFIVGGVALASWIYDVADDPFHELPDFSVAPANNGLAFRLTQRW